MTSDQKRDSIRDGSTPRVLHLFADTNVFIQCAPLESLDLSVCGDFAEVHLIVCRPVQREIDNQKNRGEDRWGRRARKAHTLFRRALIEPSNELTLRTQAPILKLRIEPHYVPTPGLANLDYSKTDDELVACVHAFKARFSSAEVRLLTHDTGPMGTSKMLGVPFMPVPDEWLTLPEPTEQEKEIASLKREVQRLQKAEPEIQIHCETVTGQRVEAASGSIHSYRPLYDAELDKFVDLLRDMFPCATDFDASSPPGTGAVANRMLGISRRYERPSARAIAEYARHLYPRWLETCREILSRVHEAANLPGRAVYRFCVQDVGTRPGRHALITIEARGKFKLRALDADFGSVAAVELPRPPAPPEGTWMMDMLGMSVHPANSKSLMTEDALFPGERGPSVSSIHSLKMAQLEFRDPNRIHWKPECPTRAVEKLTLECEQWRHASDCEYFEFEIVPDFGASVAEGALYCRIEAENLSAPVSKTVPVRLSVVAAHPCEHVFDLVDLLQTALSLRVVQ